MTILSELLKKSLRDLNVEAPVYGGELPSPELDAAENERRDQAYGKWVDDRSWHELLALLVQEQDERERGWAEKEQRRQPS